MSNALRRLAAGALLLATAACSHATKGGKKKAAAPPPEPAVVIFHNQSWELATVYAVRNAGQAIRLGTVNAGQTSRLVLPRGLVGTGGYAIDFVVRPLARNVVVRTGPLNVSPGTHLDLSLPSTLNFIAVLPADDEG
jgi:hypothetical protein